MATKPQATEPTDRIAMLAALSETVANFLNGVISAEIKMQQAHISAQKEMLQLVLKAAEAVEPENFETLVTATKEVTLSSIAAERDVAIAHLDMATTVLKGMSDVGANALSAQKGLQERKLDLEERKLDLREREIDVKVANAKTEARKAAAVLDNGIHA